MSARILDGKQLAQTMQAEIATGVAAFVQAKGIRPGLAAVLARVGGVSIELTTDAAGHATGRIELAEPRLWSPTDPHLYRVEIVVGSGSSADTVVATTGLRRIETHGSQGTLPGPESPVLSVVRAIGAAAA